MKWIAGHGPMHIVSHCYLHKILKFCCFSIINVEATLKLDYEGTITPMDLSGLHFERIYLVGIGYEGLIYSKFTLVHKDILVIMQGCTKVSE